MSDTPDHLPLDPDELASSYLDGELSDEQRDRVEADQGTMALVERHRRVRDALAAPVEPLPDEQREAMLAAALAALPAVGAMAVAEESDGTATAAGEAVEGNVVPIDPARRARRRRLIAGGLAAAAAVAVIGFVVARPGGGDGGGQATRDNGATGAESAASTAGGSAVADDAGASAGTAAGHATEAASSTLAAAAAAAPPAPLTSSAPDRGSVTSVVSPPTIVAAAGLPDLGPLADRTAFIAAAHPFATTVPAPGAGPCAGYPPPLATATFQGTPAYLVVIEQSVSGNRVALLATGTCAVLVKADLAEG